MTMSETIGVCANKVPPMTARQRLIVVLLLGANFMLSADFSILNIALPVVGEAVGLSVDNLPWVSTAFALPAAGLSLLFGRLGDLYGRRRIFLTGLFLLTTASRLGVRRRSSIARPSHRICVVSQLMCVGRPLPSQLMCAGNGHLLRVGPFIIARRYT